MPHASTEQLTAGNYHTRKLLLPSSNGREAPPILAEGSAQVYFARPIRNFRSGSWAGRVLRSRPGAVIVVLTSSHEFGWASRHSIQAGRGPPILANCKSRTMRRRVATRNVRANGPVTRVLADSEPSPSSNEHAIQRDPSELIIGM